MSNVLEIQKGFSADGHTIKKFDVQPISPGMIAAQTINTLANPNFNRVFYAENTTWMVSITSMDIYNIPSDQIYFTIYKINNVTGNMKSYRIDIQNRDYSLVNELVHVSDDKIIFAKLESFHLNFNMHYLLVDGDYVNCGYKDFLEPHPMAKDEYFINNYWSIETGIISFGTSGGNIGGLWRFTYRLKSDPKIYEIISRIEIDSSINLMSVQEMDKYSTEDLNADSNLLRLYYRANPRYVLTEHYHKKSYTVIDTKTFNTVLDFTSTQDSMVVNVSNSFNAHLYQERNETYADEFYGRRLIGLIGFGNKTQPPNYFKSVHDGYNVIHVNGSGNVGTTRINAKIKEIVAIDKYGNVYCSVFSDDWNVVFNKYSSSGALEWSTTNTVYRNRRPDVEPESQLTTQNKVFTRFDGNENLVISSMDGLQEYNFYYTYGYQYAHVINKNDGSTVSSTYNHNLPNYNGYTVVPIAFYEKHDAVSGLIKPVLLAVALTDSRNNENAIATEILTSEMEPFYYLNLSIVDEKDNRVNWNKYKIHSKINGVKASISEGSNNMKLNDMWEIDITSFAYLPESLSGVLTIDNRTVKIILKHRDWTRKRYEIRTPQELQAIGDDDLGDYHIMNDIDMVDFQWENIYTNSSKPFLGSINGNGFTIKNLTIHKNDTEITDAYGFIGNSLNATFENIKFENIELTCGGYSGILTGSLYFDRIYSKTIDEVVKPFAKDITIIDSTINVSEYSSTVGGVVGNYQSSYEMDNEVISEIVTFTNCITDNIQFNLENYAYRIGGIIGSVGIGAL